MAERLTVAVPSKGRIMEATYDFFAGAGLPIIKPGHAREYTGKIKGLPNTDVLFMSSSEIALNLDAGSIHLGVTGEDLIREKAADADATIALIKALGFGQADVVVAVPEAWIDVRTMADLDDVAHDFRTRRNRPMKVATKYLSLTQRFFAGHGLGNYRIAESSGATEGAPAAGVAELIVDITTTGATLAANNLKVLDDGVILKSQSHLAASLAAQWGEGAKAALAQILDRVTAKEAADRSFVLRFHMPDEATPLFKELENAGCMVTKAPPGDGELQCPDDRLYDAVERLREAGATGLVARRADYVFGTGNPLYAKVADRLK